jgi:protein TonB
LQAKFHNKTMKSSLLLISLLLIISLNGISQVNQIDSVQTNDTIFYPNDPDPNYLIEYETMPEFPGGPDSLLAIARRHLTYPTDLIKDSIEGRIIIRFSIDDKGIAGEVSFLRGLHPILEQQCIEMVKQLPRFKPGTMLTKTKKGWYWRPVKVWYMLPVYFGMTNRNAHNTKLVITP